MHSWSSCTSALLLAFLAWCGLHSTKAKEAMDLRKQALDLGEKVEYIGRFGLTEDDERPTMALVSEYKNEATRITNRLKGLGSFLRTLIPTSSLDDSHGGAEASPRRQLTSMKKFKRKFSPKKAMKAMKKSK